MCKYSLELAISKNGTVDAAQGDDLEIRHHRGFTKVDGDMAVVCLRNGTELVLNGDVVDWYLPEKATWGNRTCEDACDLAVTFEEREVPTHWNAYGNPHMMLMDILVRADGRYTMVHYLCNGTKARVLQVPLVPEPARELEDAN